jgi:Xaa-Pro dipeptidase
MPYNNRLRRFQKTLGTTADVAFLPISADLQYLTGVPRPMPHFGAVLHPGAWAEGAWLTSTADPILILPRMSAEFGGLSDLNAEVRVLGDHDDPDKMAREVLGAFSLPARPRIAISDRALAETATALQSILPDMRLVSATELLRQQRVVKAEEEIELMRRAGEITEAAFGDVRAQLKPGMTELDILTEIDYQLRRHGSLGPSFVSTLYTSGPHLPLIFGQPEITQNRVLTPPVSVLFDFGALVEGYCYDFGRTVAFGEPTEEFQRIFELVMASQAAGIASMRAGEVTAAEVDAAARQVIEEAGFGEAFRHRLGHGIGLDVHEPPFLTESDDTVLQEGMLFTVEPSITQFESFSSRVEDVVVVRPGGGEPLTSGFQSLFVVE